MLQDLDKTKTEISEIIALELNGCEKLEGDKLDYFMDMMEMDEIDGEIYFSETNIMMTSYEDYQKVKYYTKTDERIVDLCMSDYNIYLFIVRYFNNSRIKMALQLN